MNRRSVLRGIGVGIATACAGCTGGEVVHEVQRQVRIESGSYWRERLPGVGGAGAISYTVRANQRFDLYVFTDRAAYESYEQYHQNESAADEPPGHPELSRTAVESSSSDGFAVQTTDDGAREPFETEATSYLVVDHSGYGVGASPGEAGEALRATVDVQIVDKQLGV
jgi:hypothetical protein